MTLKFEVFTKNIELSEKVHDYVEKKVSKLDHFLNGIDDARVDLEFEKSARSAADRHVAQITIRGRGFVLRSEERADDIFTAIDESVEKIQRRIERYKGKRDQWKTAGAASAAEVIPTPEVPVPDEAEEKHVISRRKTFELVPMDENEALEQMILLGHEDFFIFFNANANKINVLYRRHNGTFGLIDPTIG